MCDKFCPKCPKRITLRPTDKWEEGARSMLQVGGLVIPLEKSVQPDTIWILKQRGAVAYAEEGVFLPQAGPDSSWVETVIDWTPQGHDHPFLIVPVKSVIWWMNSKDLALLNSSQFTKSPCDALEREQFQELNSENQEAVVTLLDKPGVYGFISVKGCSKGQYMFICAQ